MPSSFWKMCIRDRDTRNLYRKGMAAFGGIAPTYHIELLEKPTIYWDFHSLLLGIQMTVSYTHLSMSIFCPLVVGSRQ